MEPRHRPSPHRVSDNGGGDAEERSALLGPAAAAAASGGGGRTSRAAASSGGAPASAADTAAAAAWLLRVTSSPGLLPGSAEASPQRLHSDTRSSPQQQQQQQQQRRPGVGPSTFAAAAVPPPPPTTTTAHDAFFPATSPKRRYLSGSGGAAAHHHSPPYSPVAAAAAEARSVPACGRRSGGTGSHPVATGSPRSRAYAAFISMRRRTVLLINLVSIMERMDEQIVPALSRPLGCAFRAGPHQLGLITFARAAVQAVASPLGGLAGHYFDRVTVLFLGCAIWGFFCTAFSFATTVNQAIAAWAFNGVGLSLIIPNSQSLVADYYTATQRGEAFGTLMLTGALGGMLGTMFATNLGGLSPLGVPGWRLAFMGVGAVSLAIGAFTLLMAVDPTRHRTAKPGRTRPRTNRRNRQRANGRAPSTAAAPAGGPSLIPVAGDLPTHPHPHPHPHPYRATAPGDVSGGGGGGRGEIEEGEEEDGAASSRSETATDAETGGGGGQRHSPGSDWSGFEGQPLLLRRHKTGDGSGGGGGGGGGGGRGCSSVGRGAVDGADVPSPPASPETETDSTLGEVSPRRPLLRRCATSAKYDAGGGGYQHPRYSYGYGTTMECTTSSRSRSAPVITGKAGGSGGGGGGPDGGSGGGDGGGEVVVVAGCAVEGGGYESAAATAAAALGRCHDGRPALTWRRICDMITTPTFLIIILQGIVGSTPWNALVFLTLYLQLIGFSDASASSLMALLLGGTAAGALVGGWLGDRVAERFPHHGRVALVQFSVGIGVPLSVVIMRGLPLAATPGTAVMYGIAMLLKGVLTSWAGPACNNPVFAEIVPPDMRNLVYAFDRSFEGAISALGAPLVGLAAERWFGYRGVGGGGEAAACEQHNAMAGPEPDLVKARALGDAMLLFMVVPWTLCALFYTGLHWTYPRDRARALRPQVVDVMQGPPGGGGGGRAAAGGLPYKPLTVGGGGGGKADV